MRLRRAGRSIALALAVLMCAALVAPVSAGAAGPTAPPDAYENDDTAGQARSLNGRLPGAGQAPLVEQHTFDAAAAAIASFDEDWYYFDVSAQEVVWEYHYMFEAIPLNDYAVDPVIEVFGPGAPPGVIPGHVLGYAFDPGITVPGPVPPWRPPGRYAPSGSIYGGWQSQWVWSTNAGASMDFFPQAAGRYYVRIRPYGAPVNNYFDGAGAYEFRGKISAFTRIWGSNRIETAVEISRERYPDGMLDGSLMSATMHSAIVASGYNFPDALAAASLAGMVQGPILLTETGALPAATRDELLRLDPDTVYIVGGPAAVSEGVRIAIINAFATAGDTVTVQRVAGADRIETSVAIGEEMMARAASVATGSAGFAFLANGYNFPDALSASPMSAGNAVPILLTNGTSLTPDVLQFINSYGISDVVIVGGTAVVSSGVENQLRSQLGATRVLRVAGSNRYETSKEFASWSTGLPTWATPRVGTPGNPQALLAAYPWQIGVATGENFPDALSAGPFCGSDWYGLPRPLLLTPGTTLTDWVADAVGGSTNTSYLDDMMTGTAWGKFDRSYIFGGSAAVSDQVWWQLDSQT